MLILRIKDRSAEHVVHHDLCARRVRQLGHCGDVDQFEHRIARGLEEDSGGRLAQGALPLLEVVAVDEHSLDPEARQDLIDHGIAGPEQSP